MVFGAARSAKDGTLRTRMAAALPSELGDSSAPELQLQETKSYFRILSGLNCHETTVDPAAVKPLGFILHQST